jgi:hypothetical protein
MGCDCDQCRPRNQNTNDWLDAELAKDGLTRGEKLGNGVSSVCFAIEGKPNIVAKVTHDIDEMKMVDRIVRCSYPLPGIVNIFAARRIGKNPQNDQDSMLEYSERLTHLTQEQQDEFRESVAYLDPIMPDYADVLATRGVPFWKAAAFNLYQIRHDLKLIGCTHLGDFHYQNIMIRKGYGPVVSDLGFSELSPIVPARKLVPPQAAIYGSV